MDKEEIDENAAKDKEQIEDDLREGDKEEENPDKPLEAIDITPPIQAPEPEKKIDEKLNEPEVEVNEIKVEIQNVGEEIQN